MTADTGDSMLDQIHANHGVINHLVGGAHNAVQASRIGQINIYHCTHTTNKDIDDQPRKLIDHRAAATCIDLFHEVRLHFANWTHPDILPGWAPRCAMLHDDPLWRFLEISDEFIEQIEQIKHEALAARIDRLTRLLFWGARYPTLVGVQIFYFGRAACEHGIELCDAFIRDLPLPSELSLVTEFVEPSVRMTVDGVVDTPTNTVYPMREPRLLPSSDTDA